MFITSGAVLSVAHKAAAEHIDSTSNSEAKHVVDVSEFRALLIHLYAVSILWRHFAGVLHLNIDGGEGEDMSHKSLSESEFKLAVRSFCHAHAKEEISDEELAKDFQDLDKTLSGSIGFISVSG